VFAGQLYLCIQIRVVELSVCAVEKCRNASCRSLAFNVVSDVDDYTTLFV